MTTSRQPWSILFISTGETAILDADGKVIGRFTDGRDADRLMTMQEAQHKLDTAEGKLQEIEQVLRGEF